MKKKGFTLIELLAVIVILAVIALVATPLIMNVINDAKVNSFKDSGYGIIKAVEMRVAAEQINQTDGQNIAYKVDVTGEGIDYNGDRPKAGWASVDVNGEISLYMVNGDYCAYKNSTTDGKVVISSDTSDCEVMDTIASDTTLATLTANGVEYGSGGGSNSGNNGGNSGNNGGNSGNNGGSSGGNNNGQTITYTAPESSDTHLGIIYFDPTNLTRVCTAADAEANKQGMWYDCDDWGSDAACHESTKKQYNGTKTGCMKWFIYKDNGNNTVQAILSHSTTALTEYDFQGLNEDHGRVEDQYEASWQLKEDTKNWDSSLNARFPHAQEIADIVGLTSFNAATSRLTYFSNASRYWWLATNLSQGDIDGEPGTYYGYVQTYDGVVYTGQMGATSSGYWTDSGGPGTSYNGRPTIWNIYDDAMGNIATGYEEGVRPVVTVSTSNLINYSS